MTSTVLDALSKSESDFLETVKFLEETFGMVRSAEGTKCSFSISDPAKCISGECTIQYFKEEPSTVILSRRSLRNGGDWLFIERNRVYSKSVDSSGKESNLMRMTTEQVEYEIELWTNVCTNIALDRAAIQNTVLKKFLSKQATFAQLRQTVN